MQITFNATTIELELKKCALLHRGETKLDIGASV